MNKIEEILEKHLQLSSVRSKQIEDLAIEAIKEFGRLAFEAGVKEGVKQLALKVFSDECEELYTYEDFLKEIDAEGNM
jgi:hypothetical protein